MTYLQGSGWVDRPADLEPDLRGDVSCDVVVVGGGLGGMLAALTLAELGQDVVLLEADLCGWGASSRNAGYVTPTIGSDPRIIQRFYADRARGLYRMATNAVTFTEDLIGRHRIDCGYEQNGNIAAAPTAAAFRRMVATTTSGRRSTVGSAAQLGIPPAFHGGLHIHVGGTLNPGEFALGVRKTVRDSAVRVFERTAVQRVEDHGARVMVESAHGRVSASRAILTVNAYVNTLEISPKHLGVPVWVTAMETEPVTPEQLDEAGWTSRTPITTNHKVMQSFRVSRRGTIVTSTRKLQMARHADANRMPDSAVVEDLVAGLRERMPSMASVAPARAWGGWIGLTPSNMSVVGQVTPRVYYSMACNGHGLPQAPYLGALLADHVGGKPMHDDLATVWRRSPRFAPGIVNPLTLRLGWAADRLGDRLDAVRR